VKDKEARERGRDKEAVKGVKTGVEGSFQL
jgi:hypothetical protein